MQVTPICMRVQFFRMEYAQYNQHAKYQHESDVRAK